MQTSLILVCRGLTKQSKNIQVQSKTFIHQNGKKNMIYAKRSEGCKYILFDLLVYKYFVLFAFHSRLPQFVNVILSSQKHIFVQNGSLQASKSSVCEILQGIVLLQGSTFMFMKNIFFDFVSSKKKSSVPKRSTECDVED